MNSASYDKKNMSCFLCGKKDHYIWECKFLKNKKWEDGNVNELIVIKDIIAMVSDVCNNMITFFHMTIITNPSDVCNYKAYFKTNGKSSI